MIFDRSLIPQQQQVVQRGGGGGAGQGFKSSIPGEEYFGIPNAPEGLQYTGQLAKSSADLYKKRQDLINYAKSQWTKNKIDVTNPDPSRPEAVMAAEVYKMEIANFLAKVDQAKEGQKLMDNMIKGQMNNTFQIGDNIDAQYASTMTPDQLGYSKNLDPLTQFAGGQLGKTFDSGADYKRAIAERNQLVGMQPQDDSMSSQRARAAAEAINPAINVPAPKSDSGNNTDNLHEGYLKKYAYLAKGAPEMFKPSGSFKEDTGSEYLISSEDSGYSLGKGSSGKDFVVSHYIHDPDTRTTYAVSYAGDKKELNPDRLLSFVSEISDSNRGGIITGASLRKYLNEKADKNKFQDYSADYFLAGDEKAAAEQLTQQSKEKGVVKQEERKAQEEHLATFRKDKFIGGWINPGNWFSDKKVGTYLANNGVEFSVDQNYGDSDKLHIENWKQLVPVDDKGKIKKDAKGNIKIGSFVANESVFKDGMTPTQLRQFMEAIGSKDNNLYEFEGDQFTMDELKEVLSPDEIAVNIKNGNIARK